MTKFEILDELYQNSINYAKKSEKELRALADESRKPKAAWVDVYNNYKKGKINWVFAIQLLTGVICYTTEEQNSKLGIKFED